MSKAMGRETKKHIRTLSLGIDAPYNTTADINAYFEEFANLIKTYGVTPDVTLFMKLRTIDTGYFITKGKLEELQDAIEKNDIEQVIISEPLTVQQERNLNTVLNCTVIDRTKLILEIFEQSAHSAEGKTQVAIAKLQHEKSRLAGKGIHLSQQAGHTGMRGGPGETLKERERRHIEESVLKLKKQLQKVEKSRETQRKQRLTSNITQICIIGYTNAGKSTILNALTKSNVLAENKLFATLDTTTRELYVNGKKKGLISDTVGFIQQLPTQLIEAFKSTLAELQYAHLLIHVVDIADKNWESHIQVVQNILNELNVHTDMLYVFNKADKVESLESLHERLALYQPHVIVSALSPKTLLPLVEYLETWEPIIHTHGSP